MLLFSIEATKPHQQPRNRDITFNFMPFQFGYIQIFIRSLLTVVYIEMYHLIFPLIFTVHHDTDVC